MLAKACLVTEENKYYISERFIIDEEHINDLVGFYIIADFGDDDIYSFLSKIGLEKLYNRTGKELDNGFFEIEKKD
jgi:hypothetical protein